MRSTFHESFAQGEIKPPSDRSSGIVFVAVALLVAYLGRANETILFTASGLAGVLAVLTAFAPTLLRPLNLLWFRFSMLLHRIVNPLVMFTIFTVVIIPGGLLMRLWCDPLRARRAPDSNTYWLERSEDGLASSSMRNQF